MPLACAIVGTSTIIVPSLFSISFPVSTRASYSDVRSDTNGETWAVGYDNDDRTRAPYRWTTTGWVRIDGVDADEILGVFREEPEFLFAVKQCILRLLLGRDILRDAEFHLLIHDLPFYGDIPHPTLFGDDAAGERGFITGIFLMLDTSGELFRHRVLRFARRRPG